MAADYGDYLDDPSMQREFWKKVNAMLSESPPTRNGPPGVKTHGHPLDNALLILAYSLLALTAVFGNSLVCYVILKNQRLRTATNLLITNLAVADLLVICLNVPFNILWHVLYDWPFGESLCHLMNFSLMVSVYVSTYTLSAIALDRHRVVLKPLAQRMSKSRAGALLALIWTLAVLLSLPYGVYTRVERRQIILREDRTPVIHCVRRCRSDYPSPSARFGQCLTVATIVVQYCLPLALIGWAYGRIVRSLWSRSPVGAVTLLQQQWQARAKRKSIKVLIAVVVVFALCWLPLNLYHLLTDLHPNPGLFKYNSKAFFACHWVAVSSTCYNPFVYCWLNQHFREEVRARFRWCTGRLKPPSCPGRARESRTDLGHASCRTSLAHGNSVRHVELTLLSDPDDLQLTCLNPPDVPWEEEGEGGGGGKGQVEVGGGEEGSGLLALHRNGRVEFHVTRLHKCISD